MTGSTSTAVQFADANKPFNGTPGNPWSVCRPAYEQSSTSLFDPGSIPHCASDVLSHPNDDIIEYQRFNVNRYDSLTEWFVDEFLMSHCVDMMMLMLVRAVYHFEHGCASKGHVRSLSPFPVQIHATYDAAIPQKGLIKYFSLIHHIEF